MDNRFKIDNAMATDMYFIDTLFSMCNVFFEVQNDISLQATIAITVDNSIKHIVCVNETRRRDTLKDGKVEFLFTKEPASGNNHLINEDSFGGNAKFKSGLFKSSHYFHKNGDMAETQIFEPKSLPEETTSNGNEQQTQLIDKTSSSDSIILKGKKKIQILDREKEATASTSQFETQIFDKPIVVKKVYEKDRVECDAETMDFEKSMSEVDEVISKRTQDHSQIETQVFAKPFSGIAQRKPDNLTTETGLETQIFKMPPTEMFHLTRKRVENDAETQIFEPNTRNLNALQNIDVNNEIETQIFVKPNIGTTMSEKLQIQDVETQIFEKSPTENVSENVSIHSERATQIFVKPKIGSIMSEKVQTQDVETQIFEKSPTENVSENINIHSERATQIFVKPKIGSIMSEKVQTQDVETQIFEISPTENVSENVSIHSERGTQIFVKQKVDNTMSEKVQSQDDETQIVEETTEMLGIKPVASQCQETQVFDVKSLELDMPETQTFDDDIEKVRKDNVPSSDQDIFYESDSDTVDNLMNCTDVPSTSASSSFIKDMNFKHVDGNVSDCQNKKKRKDTLQANSSYSKMQIKNTAVESSVHFDMMDEQSKNESSNDSFSCSLNQALARKEKNSGSFSYERDCEEDFLENTQSYRYPGTLSQKSRSSTSKILEASEEKNNVSCKKTTPFKFVNIKDKTKNGENGPDTQKVNIVNNNFSTQDTDKTHKIICGGKFAATSASDENMNRNERITSLTKLPKSSENSVEDNQYSLNPGTNEPGQDLHTNNTIPPTEIQSTSGLTPIVNGLHMSRHKQCSPNFMGDSDSDDDSEPLPPLENILKNKNYFVLNNDFISSKQESALITNVPGTSGKVNNVDNNCINFDNSTNSEEPLISSIDKVSQVRLKEATVDSDDSTDSEQEISLSSNTAINRVNAPKKQASEAFLISDSRKKLLKNSLSQIRSDKIQRNSPLKKSPPKKINPQKKIVRKVKAKRRKACGKCGPCKVKRDCGKCSSCLNKKKLKQKCKERKCIQLKDIKVKKAAANSKNIEKPKMNNDISEDFIDLTQREETSDESKSCDSDSTCAVNNNSSVIGSRSNSVESVKDMNSSILKESKQSKNSATLYVENSSSHNNGKKGEKRKILSLSQASKPSTECSELSSNMNECMVPDSKKHKKGKIVIKKLSSE